MTRFRMFKISTLQFAILEERCDGDYSLGTATELRNSADGSAIAVVTTFTFAKGDSKAMVLQVMCEFVIHPDDLASMTNGGKVVIPKSLLEHFLVHTVGTARGILHCKTEGTPFNAMILPPMDVTGIVHSDLVIEKPRQ